ncbi:putative AT DNA binding protein [Aspergillus undulatus]|uniref:putative AT DNA binding protein n=1 Tax=Aspergillus undulatus TaxID=1810928 RepID=UPI003CCE1BD2
MSTTKENPWTEDENFALLVEIMKKEGIPSSRLVTLIDECQITPKWNDIPLPSGRSLNSCMSAYRVLCSASQPPVNPGSGTLPPTRHPGPAPQMSAIDPSSNARNRSLYSADKGPYHPIQPRPAHGQASHGSETGASTFIPPGMESVTTPGDRRKKRGRPTKAESEARKLSKVAAESRGEPYSSGRQPVSQNVLTPSTPVSPAVIQSGAPFYTTQTSSRPPNVPPSTMYHQQPQPQRTMSVPGPSDNERFRSMLNRESVPPSRQLPRPQEPRQTLPSLQSSQALPIAYRDSMPRTEAGDRSYGSVPPERVSFLDSSRSLLNPSPRHPDEPQAPDIQPPLTTTAEKR